MRCNSPGMNFTVLGSIGTVVEGRFVAITGARQRILLTTLLLTAGRLLPSEQLYSELWGENPPESVENALQAHVSRLRRTLRLHAGEKMQPPPLIGGPSGYQLLVAPMDVDVHVFRERLAQARTAVQQDPSMARDLLEAVLALWRGPLPQELAASPLCRSAAVQVEEEYLTAQESRLELELRYGAPADVISELRRLGMMHPWRERITELLMLALYRTGRQAEAVETYNAMRARLVGELGIEPSLRLRELFRQILNQAPALEPLRGMALSLDE
jgi:SARP family transcriptional regulator, regulator of embCAB operon